MKKWFIYLLVIMFVTGCKTNVEKNESENTEVIVEKKVLNIYQYKLEIVEPLSRLAKEYEKLHPDVEINLKNSGGTYYVEMLKAEFAFENQVDIFNVGSVEILKDWSQVVEDLTDEPFNAVVNDDVEMLTIDGKVYGIPYNIEGYGLIYNKELFEEAGIDQLPIHMAEFKKMVLDLENAGILPFYNDYQEWWVLSQHSFNLVLEGQNDPDLFIEKLKKGKADLTNNEVFNDWLDMTEFMMEHGQPDPFLTGYSETLESFAAGKVAMIFQGNWTQDQLDALNPDLELGILSLPVCKKLEGKIAIGVPNYWCVNSQSDMKDVAKDFLNFMFMSEIGKDYYINEFKFIPPFTHIDYDIENLGDLAVEVNHYVEDGQFYGWHWKELPEGSINEINQYLNRYFQKELSRDELVNKIEAIMVDLAN